MDILLTGDLHNGGSRREIRERVLDFVVEESDRRNVATVVVPGDWFHTTTDAAVRLYSMDLIGWGTRRCPWIIVDGNHDGEHETAILPRFATTHPAHVFGEPAAAVLATKAGPLAVAALPDLRGRMLARRLERMPAGSSPTDAAHAILDDLGGEFETCVELGGGEALPRLFVGHLTLGSARMDNDQPARGADVTFALDRLRAVRAHAYALGHIHLRQMWMLDGRPVFYTGAPYATTYGDLGPRSITVLHWNGSGFDVELVPTPAPRLIHLVGTWRRDGDVGEMSLAYDEAHETEDVPLVSTLAGADVRLQYTVPLDDAAAAKRAVREHQASILAAGAVRCEPDPRPALVGRTRTSALAGARTLAEKVAAYWQASGTSPDPERRDRVLAHLARVEPLAPTSPPVSLVRVDRMGWAAVGPLGAGTLTLPAGVHAVSGPNKVGKSTLLSLLTTGLWLDGPKGSLDKLAGPSARTLLAVTTPHGAWTVEQKVQTKRVSVRGDDVYDGGREAYYELAERRFPPIDVLKSVCFLKRGSLLDVVDAKLKDRLLTIGGSDILPALATIVRKELAAAERAREDVARDVSSAGDPWSILDAAKARLHRASQEAARASAARGKARELHARATERARLEGELAGAEDRRARAASRRETLAAAQVQAEDIRAAAALHTAAIAARTTAEAEERHADGEAATHRRNAADAKEERARTDRRIAENRARIAVLDARLAERPACEAAVASLPEARARLAAAESALSMAGSTGDAEPLRVSIRTIRQVASAARLKPSHRSMESGLLRVRDLADVALARGAGGGTDLAAAIRTRDGAAAAVATAEQRAIELADLASVERERGLIAVAVETDEALVFLLSAKERGAEEHASTWEAAAASAAERAEEAAATGQKHAPLAAKLADVDRAAGALAALDEQLASLAEEEETARGALATHDTAGAPGVRLTPIQEAELDRAVGQANREAAREEQAVLAIQKRVERLAADRGRLLAAELDCGDLTELVRVLDRDGTQAYEAAAVGEAIADDASDLLQKHGFRCLVSFDATRPTAAGKRYVEQARWTILNLDSGKKYDARADDGGASDGEAVIVGTAVFLGAAIGVARRGGGVENATLALDERTGAIREELVEQWLSMLRDGAGRAGASTVLLVPPNDERLVAACDGKILVEPAPDGSVVRRAS